MSNLLLERLRAEGLDDLDPLVEGQVLVRGRSLELPGHAVQHAHFLDKGFVSILMQVGDRTAEIGLVGREGMLGLPAVLGSKVSQYQAVVRQDAHVRSVPVEALRSRLATRPKLGAILLRYMQAGVAQIAHTAFANAHLTVPQRLARWLLMAHDRIEGDTLQLTHATLSDALGVQRSGVTIALHQLESEQAVRNRAQALTIVDRQILIARTSGSYGPAERAYDLLLGGNAFCR